MQKNSRISKLKKQVDLKHMFRHACAFVECAESCELDPTHINHRTASHLTADMVNSGLAYEIYLKALLVHHGIDLESLKRIHELQDLWNKYNDEDKKSAMEIREFINRQWFCSNNEPFGELFAELSRAFVNRRYIYTNSIV